MSRSNSKAAAVVVRGPFGPFATAYGAELRELGYTPLGVVKQLRQLARLSRWLEQAGMGAAELSDDALERFVAAGLGLGTASTPGLAALLVVVRRAGIAAEAAQVSEAVDDGLLVSFRRHLLAERGIGESTADRYVDYARRFLAGQSGACSPRRRSRAACSTRPPGWRWRLLNTSWQVCARSCGSASSRA